MKSKLFLFFLVFNVFVVNAQVDLRTGNASYSIPIFEHLDSKNGLETSVALSYNSNGGILVNEYASSVGQGWSINAGGYIIRMQKDEPDDQFQVNSFSGLDNNSVISERNNQYAFDNYYANGYLFTGFAVTDLPKERAISARYPNDGNSSKYLSSPRAQSDKEQDIFYLSLPKRSLSFVINPNGTFTVLDGSKVTITTNYFDNSFMASNKIQTRIKSFTVKDETGVIYLFEEYEKTFLTQNEMEFSDNGDNPSMSITKTVKTDKSVISKWHLSKIMNPFTNNAIEFIYSTKVDFSSLSSIIPTYIEHIPVNILNKKSRNVNIGKFTSYSERKTLVQINYSDGFKVLFGSNGFNERYDLGAPLGIISSIKVKNPKDELMHSLSLFFKYFYRGTYKTNAPYYVNDNDKRFLRLCLAEVVLDEGVALKKYTFDYNTGTYGTSNIVAPMFSLAQDAWGYYKPSAQINDESSSYDKNAIKGFLQANPTTNRAAALNQAKTGLLSKITLPTGGTIEFDYEQNDVQYNNQNVYVGGVRLFKVKNTDALTGGYTETLYSYKDNNNLSSGWGYDNLTNYRASIYLHKKNTIPGGEPYPVNGIFAKRMAVTILLKLLNNQGVDKLLNYLIPGYGQVKLIIDLILLIATLVDDTANYSVYEWNYNCDLQSNPLGCNYSRVVAESSNINNGKTIYEFTKPTNIATDISPLSFPFAQKQRYEFWKYFLPQKTLVYNNTGSIVKTIEYFYNTSNWSQSLNLNINYGVNTYLSVPYDWPVTASNNISAGNFISDNYYLKSGYSQLIQTKEKSYGKAGRVSEVNVYNDYTGSTNLQPRETYSFNSKGEKGGTTIYYTSDYNFSSGAMYELKAKNIINLPVAKLSWYIPVGSTTKMYTGIAINEYTIAPNGEVKIYKSYKDYNNAPVPSTAVGSFNPNSIFITYPNVQQVMEAGYDTNGDIVDSKKEGNQKIAYVYDYDGRFATATVVNAVANDIAYCSFETTNTGNFTLNSVNYTDNKYAPTGIRYASLGSTASITKPGLSAVQTYIVSYWSRNGSLSINGATSLPKYSINGWNLYVQEITSVVGVTMLTVPTGTDDVEVDELRLYPKNARMGTVVYDQSFGKIAECDVNNRITYYQYDKIGRLAVIQDENRNATKTFDYNTKN
jgi:YD repeat-containing protein